MDETARAVRRDQCLGTLHGVRKGLQGREWEMSERGQFADRSEPLRLAILQRVVTALSGGTL